LPALRARIDALNKNPDLLHLQDDVSALTALRDVILSGAVELDVADLTRVLATIAQVKGNLYGPSRSRGRPSSRSKK